MSYSKQPVKKEIVKRKNFLRQFRDETSKEFKELTATQFFEVWNHYDVDGNC